MKTKHVKSMQWSCTTLNSQIPSPQQRQETNASGDAPMKERSRWRNSPQSDIENCEWRVLYNVLYFARASLSCLQPHVVAADLNCDNSWWQIDMMRLVEGNAGSVEHTAFNLDAVILPLLIWCQRRELRWLLVFSSAIRAWADITETFVAWTIWSNS